EPLVRALERPVAGPLVVVIEAQLSVGVVAALAESAERALVHIVLLVAARAVLAAPAVVGEVSPRMTSLAQHVLVVADQRPPGPRVVIEEARLPASSCVTGKALTAERAPVQLVGMAGGAALERPAGEQVVGMALAAGDALVPFDERKARAWTMELVH